MRHSTFDLLVEEVEVLHANPQYAHGRLPSGVESTVSVRDLAPTSRRGRDDLPAGEKSAGPTPVQELGMQPYVMPQ